jgi:hypothetical protein
MFAVDFVQSLKPQHLSSFWYFASPQNFALIGVFGTLLLSTAPNPEEAEFYRSKLREYRWILKINSENGARYMKPAMALLDANMALLTASENNSENDTPNFNSIEKISSEPSGPLVLSNNGLVPSDQYPTDDQYYSSTREAGLSASPIIYSPSSVDVSQAQDFGYGVDDRSMWAF